MRRFYAFLFSALWILATTSPARAAVDMYLQLDGIEGESTDAGHAGSIELLAWSWGVSNNVSVGGGGSGTSKPNFQDVSFTKYTDSTSVPLFASLVQGKFIDTAELEVVGAFGKTAYSFTDVAMTSLSQGGSGGEDRPTENASFTFRTVTFQTFTQSPSGAFIAGPIFGWDAAAGEALPSVPEPSTWALLCAGLALLAIIRARRPR